MDLSLLKAPQGIRAHIGLAPGDSGTGGKVNIGHLKRSHYRYLRPLLIDGARSAVCRLGDKQDAQSRWLRGLLERHGFDIASVALAHKNARQAWAILAKEQLIQTGEVHISGPISGPLAAMQPVRQKSRPRGRSYKINVFYVAPLSRYDNAACNASS